MRFAATGFMSTASQAAATADHAHAEAAPWIERLARAGYVAKGVLYTIVGFLAIKAAFGTGDADGSKGALTTLAGEGILGTILLWLIAIGLLAYTAWNAFRAIMDPENEGTDKKGIVKRIFFGVSAALHLSLAIWVFTHLLGSGGGGGSGSEDGGTQGLVGSILSWGMVGRLLVGAAGVGIIGYAVQQLIKAYKVDLSDMLDLSSLSPDKRKVAESIGRLGLAARGVVFTLVGFFFVQSAWQYNPKESGGLNKALETLGAFGPWILAAVALGLFCYGLFMLIKAKYRIIEAK
jgi:hypothetical protein